jgi:hypothetical protein
MRCFHCREDIKNEYKMTHIGDGDFVHDTCEQPYKDEKDHFLNVVIQDEDMVAAWVMGGDV